MMTAIYDALNTLLTSGRMLLINIKEKEENALYMDEYVINLLSGKGLSRHFCGNGLLTLYHTVPTFNDPEIEAF